LEGALGDTPAGEWNVKGILVHVIGAVATFIIAVLFMLLLNGMLRSKPPFIGGHARNAVVDSTAVQAEPPATEPAERHSTVGNGDPNAAGALDRAEDAAPPIVPGIDTGLHNYPAGADDPASEDVVAQDASIAGADSPAEDTSAPSPADPQQLVRLVRVYEKMRPKQVAQVFDSLPDDQTVAMLSKMSERAAAKVIAAMEPTNAARLSQMMVRTGMP
jgi:hypothetical protein